jgi:2-oxoglutarate dehydrogenase E2 component (dihydrolipoamide succinyltransferase)
VQSSDNRFYSPLVKNIAVAEGISQQELDQISGTGKSGRVTKNDILKFVENRSTQPLLKETTTINKQATQKQSKTVSTTPVSVNGGDEIIEMTRMGKLIAHHMVESVQTSAHVQSFIEADVTKIWNWRKKVKDGFTKREGENLTFTPIFLEAVAKALKDFPMLNISVDGDKIIKRKNINLGMAAALADGNLIVPVIKNADQLNLVGMSKAVNDLAQRARGGQLKPDDIQGGTYTVTNVGTFGSIMGTPIINQPQVGILALGAIRKVPAVIETSEGDFIGIRYKMFLSHSYDHRVVNGALGGQFVKAVADYLESWDLNREI